MINIPDWQKRVISILNTLEAELPTTPENQQSHDNIQIALLEIPDELVDAYGSDDYWFRPVTKD